MVQLTGRWAAGFSRHLVSLGYTQWGSVGMFTSFLVSLTLQELLILAKQSSLWDWWGHSPLVLGPLGPPPLSALGDL